MDQSFFGESSIDCRLTVGSPSGDCRERQVNNREILEDNNILLILFVYVRFFL